MSQSRLFVLDTNVLMHDPTALYRFEEHDIFLPMMVLEELDAAKKGLSEVARNARQASRFLDEIIADSDRIAIDAGLPIKNALSHDDDREPIFKAQGKLYLQTGPFEVDLSEFNGHLPDNKILSAALSLSKQHEDKHVTLVSKDINLRIKAHVVGLSAEDYSNDKTLDDATLLYPGVKALAEDFWDSHGKNMQCEQDQDQTLYHISGPEVAQFYPNECVYIDGDAPFEAIVSRCEEEKLHIRHAKDFRNPGNSVWGITARNREQNFALNLLMDPEIDFITLLGTAGTGKTLLTLAAGLAQTLDTAIYKEIIMTRVTVSVGEDIGFLPGTEEEKMTPWMGALMDNLEVLTQEQDSGDWARAATAELINKRIKIRSLNFMRGRTFLNRYLIIDEAQNLTSKQMKTLITRAGPGTKIVCLGNIAQIDTPYLTETTSGLTYVVDRFKTWEHSGHIILVRGERSRLADYASDRL